MVIVPVSNGVAPVVPDMMAGPELVKGPDIPSRNDPDMQLIVPVVAPPPEKVPVHVLLPEL
jgi:hypothetical protein